MKYMEPELISVVMPCYNAEKYIRESLDSLLNQSYKNLEIILINDGSTDSTREICLNYIKDYSNIVFIDLYENKGLINALNLGIDRAQGKYIARMDADDISIENRFERLIKAFKMNPWAELVSSASAMIDHNSNFIQIIKPKATLPGSIKFVSLFSTPFIHGSVMAKNNIFRENLYEYKYIHSEDYRLFSKLALLGYKLMVIPKVLYKLRINPESVSNKYEKIQIKTHQIISKENIIFYFGEAPDSRLLSIIINRFDFDPEIQEIRMAFRILSLYQNIFIKNEACSYKEVSEINYFVVEQKLDILIQALKYSTGFFKAKKLLLILLFNKSTYSLRGMSYILNKLFKRVKTRN